jgi:hypothetical protein
VVSVNGSLGEALGASAATKAAARAEPVPPSAMAVLSLDADGRQIVSISVKHAYRISPTGACKPAEVPEPLLFTREGTGLDDLGVPESDVIPFKQATDLIVMADAHAPSRTTTQMDVWLRTGKLERVHRVYGERRCIYRGQGSYTFSEAAPFESVPLRYSLAYGGEDPSWVMPEKIRLEEMFFLPQSYYPRNTVGRGYVLRENRERIDGMLLPQIENPGDLLTPGRLVVGDPENWWRQPFPWSCDWFDALWYPRQSFLGVLPRGLPEDDRELFEVRAGWVAPGQQQRLRGTPEAERIDPRFADGASPGLIVPLMRGDEQVQLEGVLPGGKSLTLTLPGRMPKITVRFEGKQHDVPARVHRVLISTRRMGLYLVWHGAFYPDRPLPLQHVTRAHRDVTDLEGVVATADGVPVISYDEWSQQTPSQRQETYERAPES